MPMPTIADAELTSSDHAPFSNSDDGAAWTALWCDTCAHDAPARTGDPGNGCPLLLVALTGRTPAQWSPTGDTSLRYRYKCSKYRRQRHTPPRTPPKPGNVPGQQSIFEALGEGRHEEP